MDTLQSADSPSLRYEPDPQTRRRKIHCKQELSVSSLQRFYASRTDIAEIVSMLQGTSDISLRVIDWFVTNYAKAHSTAYILNGQEFLVYRDYKSQLKAYSKKLFDPFCRRERIYFQVPNHPSFVTTVAKLNFFRWAIEKGIIDYIKLNLTKIEKEMNTNAREQQKLRKQLDTPSTGQNSAASTATAGTATTAGTTRRRARVHTGQNGGKSIEKHDLQVEVRFD